MENKTWHFDDFQIGQHFPPSRYSISAQDNDAFLSTFALGPIRVESSPPNEVTAVKRDRPVRPVHPTLVGSFQPQHAAFAWPTGVLHAREKVRLSAPVYPGEALEARVSIKDKYEKNDRKFVVLEIIVRKLENGIDALTVERTLVWPM